MIKAFKIVGIIITITASSQLYPQTVNAKVTSAHIIIHIIKEYIQLVLIALIIVTPILFRGVKFWLHNFPVRISIWLFIIPIIFVIIITILSIASHAFRA
jgi:hypothetical protein